VAIGGQAGAVRVGVVARIMSTAVSAATVSLIVAVGAMAGTHVGGMVRNGVAEDGRTEDVETGHLAGAWDHVSHLVRTTSADLTARHLVAAASVAVLAAGACILETCGRCTPDVRNIT